jgi:hypothetical protein
MPYRKLRFVFAIGLCLSLFASSQFTPVAQAETKTFTDVDPNSTSPYAVAIYALAQRNILNGYNDGRFGPLDPLIRAQAAAVVVRALGWSGDQGRSNFSDQGTIDNELWNSVRVLADRGIARGFGDGTYRPGSPVAQAQVVSLITRAMVNKGYWVNQPDADTLYPDVPMSSGARTDIVTYDHYVGYISYAANKGAGGWTNWSKASDRQGVALIVWDALQHTDPATVTPPTPGLPPAVAGQPCPTWVHDRYVTQGPDSKMYPTWHPPVDQQYGCTFGHEHGADPRTSNANNAMPPFGYAAAQMGMHEPHEGYKVFVINKGTHFENSTAQADYRIVFHMGTSGVGRYTQEFHSVQYDYVAGDGTGRYAHIYGLADTGAKVGSTCSVPRQGGRDFSTIGCNDSYEIWTFDFSLKYPGEYTDAMHVRTYMSGSVAAFDPITTRDPADNSRLVYTQDYRLPQLGIDPLSTNASFLGCKREAYGGPNYWNNRGKATVYYTDVYGNIQPGPGPGLIRQETSAVTSNTNELFKYRQDFCGNGIHTPN